MRALQAAVAQLGVGSNSMRRVLVIATLVVLAAGISAFLILSESTRDWRPRVSFSGFTNTSGGGFAVFQISNRFKEPILLHDTFDIEYVGVVPSRPVPGHTNVIRMLNTGTNLTIQGFSSAEFLMPIPTSGDSWVVNLSFVQNSFRKEIRDDLALKHGRKRWYKFLPLCLRGYPAPHVSLTFTAEGTAN